MEQEHQVYFAFGVFLVSQEIISESNAPLSSFSSTVEVCHKPNLAMYYFETVSSL